MTLKVFVSSTKDDLDPDCRPRVLEAIKESAAVAVTMEDWNAEYLSALELVLQKIEESTHYLGLFAYRRGWTPPGGTVSITEEEFIHARRRMPRERLAVFIPQEGSEIAEVLRTRAEKDQTLADAEAQAAFLSRVRADGVVMSFRDVPHLSLRAGRCIMSWQGSIVARTPEWPAPRTAAPAPDDMAELGRRRQVECFRDRVLDRLAGAGAAAADGVLVVGAAGYGHARMIERLHRVFEGVSHRIKTCSIGCGLLWRGDSLRELLASLGRATGLAAPITVAEAAAQLGLLLAQNDVVLQVTRLQHFEYGVHGFVEQFWAPLVDALPHTSYRLLCLATYEGDPAAQTGAWAGTVEPCGSSPADPRRLALLPALEPFTASEVALFVRRRVPPESVEGLVRALMADTEGAPDRLYALLVDPTIWPASSPGDPDR